MAKHQVFLLHGMGEYEPGWSVAVQKPLVDALQRYPDWRDDGFVHGVEFKEITYSQVFNAWRQQWQEDAKAAAAALTAEGLSKGAAAELVKLAAKPSGGGFLRTHVLDVVAYRFLLPVAQEIWRSVEKQILGHLRGLPRTDALHYTVIGHSLGSAVAYEAFHAMMTQGIDDEGVRLGSAFKPDNVCLVANAVKPLWNRRGTVYQPVMAPSLSTGDGWCFRMASFGHELDPLSQLDRFDPPDSWFPQMAPRRRVYQDITLPAADLQDANVHAFEHYLGHPRVHVPVLRLVTGFPEAVTPEELKAAETEWRSQGLGAAARSQAKAAATARLQGLLTKATEGWGDEIAMLIALRKIAAASALKDGEK